MPRPDAWTYPVVGMFSLSVSERLVQLVTNSVVRARRTESYKQSDPPTRDVWDIRDVGTGIRRARATFKEFRRGHRPFQLMCPSWSHYGAELPTNPCILMITRLVGLP